jgi:MFS family permease
MNKSNPNSILVKATLLLTSTLTVMAGATIAPSLPEMRTHFAAVENADYLVRLVLTLPALFIVIGSPIAGLIVDRFGRKPLLAASVFLYGLAGSSGYLLNDLGSILLGRALLGLAVGGIMTSATTLIADYYIGAARAYFLGLQAAFMGFGGVLFLSFGGWLAEITWQSPFLIYLFALMILPLIVFLLYEPDRPIVRKSSPEGEEIRQSAAPVKLLMLIYGVAVLTQIIFYLIPVQLPFYLKSLSNATASQSGLAIAFATLFSSFASIAYGRIKTRLNFITILTLIFGLLGVGYTIIGLVKSYELVLIGLAIAGLGLGLLMPNLTVWVSTIVSDTLRGRALGGLTTFFFLGQFLSPIFSQPLSQQIGLDNTYTLAGGLLLLLALTFAGMKQFSKVFK